MKTILTLALLAILLVAPAADGGEQKNVTAAKTAQTPTPTPTPAPTASATPTASPSPTPTATPDQVSTQIDETAPTEEEPLAPGKFAKDIGASIDAIKKQKTLALRLKKLDALKAILANGEKEGDVEAIRYSVALDPIFEKAKTLKNENACLSVRGQIVYGYTAGTGYKPGPTPYFVADTLSVLAAVCGLPSMEADEDEFID